MLFVSVSNNYLSQSNIDRESIILRGVRTGSEDCREEYAWGEKDCERVDLFLFMYFDTACLYYLPGFE